MTMFSKIRKLVALKAEYPDHLTEAHAVDVLSALRANFLLDASGKPGQVDGWGNLRVQLDATIQGQKVSLNVEVRALDEITDILVVSYRNDSPIQTSRPKGVGSRADVFYVVRGATRNE
jgi:hypothetical protein